MPDRLLRSLAEACKPRCLIGCSSTGEFTSEVPRESSACAMAFRSPEVQFSCGVGRGLCLAKPL